MIGDTRHLRLPLAPVSEVCRSGTLRSAQGDSGLKGSLHVILSDLSSEALVKEEARNPVLKKPDFCNDHYSERAWGSFERVIPLLVEVEASEAKARFADGVLEITVPKTEAARAKQPVKVNIE